MRAHGAVGSFGRRMRALGDLTDEQRAVNKAAQEAILLRIDLTKKEGEAQTAHAANRKALEDETTLWKSMADTAAGFFEDLFQNGRARSVGCGSGEIVLRKTGRAVAESAGAGISMSAAAASWARSGSILGGSSGGGA